MKSCAEKIDLKLVASDLKAYFWRLCKHLKKADCMHGWSWKARWEGWMLLDRLSKVFHRNYVYSRKKAYTQPILTIKCSLITEVPLQISLALKRCPTSLHLGRLEIPTRSTRCWMWFRSGRWHFVYMLCIWFGTIIPIWRADWQQRNGCLKSCFFCS